jgi:carboxymethylenebutenolidase
MSAMNVADSTVDLATPTGPMRTYVYRPVDGRRSDKRYPGLILYSEIFQQTLPVRRLATQFAGHGYIVMVPEVYHSHEPAGTVLGYDDAGKNRGNALKTIIPITDFDADARVLLHALAADLTCSGRLGGVGICLGGHLAFRAALNPEVRATACFYPTDLQGGTLGAGGDDSLKRAGEIKGELMLVFGRQDPHIPLEGRRIIAQRLEEARVCYTWHEFNAAHAFLRDEGERYNPALARIAFGLALELFGRVL